jgi:AcrR family transcriptional regulator
MAEYLRTALDEAASRGFRRTRWIATMGWINSLGVDPAEVVAYEERVDRIMRSRGDVVACAYDLDVHGARLVTGVLGAHALALVDGALRARRPYDSEPPRDRIVAAAHDHFHNAGIRATGIDTIIETAGVAKATFYHHFPAKDDLVLAWLADERPRWFHAIRDRLSDDPADANRLVRLLFDHVAAWIEDEGFRGCAFQNAAVELTDTMHPAHFVIREYLDEIDRWIDDALATRGVRSHRRLAREIGVLLAGAIASAVARRSTGPVLDARAAGVRLLEASARI